VRHVTSTSSSFVVTEDEYGEDEQDDDSCETKKKSSRSSRTALAWLRTTLRCRDNLVLDLAAIHGADGLAVVYVWRHGRTMIPSTPAHVWECAAVHSLNETLLSMGHTLILINNDDVWSDNPNKEEEEPNNNHLLEDDSISCRAVAKLAITLGVDTVVVDHNDNPSDRLLQQHLESALEEWRKSDAAGMIAVEAVTGDDRLTDPTKDGKVLGRARLGGRVFRWPVFLQGMTNNRSKYENMSSSLLLQDEKMTMPTTLSLPPALEYDLHDDTNYKTTQCLPDPTAAGEWAKVLLERWGPVTEEEAWRRASCPIDSMHSTTPSLPRTGDETPPMDRFLGEGKPPSTRLSPYLRWGMISPKRAASGQVVRERDLLWRDWSYLCHDRIHALQRGEPVIPALDGCCLASTKKERDMIGDVWGGRHDSSLSQNTSAAATTTNDPQKEEHNYLEENLVFAAWCVGKTGAPLVDAGMRQLWKEGWMPRRLRLLAACCLVEGMGLDWRTGRDWFEHTLIDHDPAINELMWQNAGLCGVDPFYSGLKWEAIEDDESVVPGDPHHVERWISDEQLQWPSGILRDVADQTTSPSIEKVREVAESRRCQLRKMGVYKAAKRVAMSGVRVAWEGCPASEVLPGEVCAIGRTKLDTVDFGIRDLSNPEILLDRNQ